MDKIRKIRIITVITTVFSFIMLGLGAVMGSISAYIFTQMNLRYDRNGFKWEVKYVTIYEYV